MAEARSYSSPASSAKLCNKHDNQRCKNTNFFVMFARLRPSKVLQAVSQQIWWTARTVVSTARNAVEPTGVTSCENVLSFMHSPTLSMGTAGVDRHRIIHRGLRTSARTCHGGIVEHDELVKLIEGKDAGADAVDFSLIVRGLHLA